MTVQALSLAVAHWLANFLVVPFIVGVIASLITNHLTAFAEQRRVILAALSDLPLALVKLYREDPANFEGMRRYWLLKPIDDAAGQMAFLGHPKAAMRVREIVSHIRFDLGQIALRLAPSHYTVPSPFSIQHEEGGKRHQVLPIRENVEDTIMHYFAGNGDQISKDFLSCSWDPMTVFLMRRFFRNERVYKARRQLRRRREAFRRWVNGDA